MYDNGSVFQHFEKTTFFKEYTLQDGGILHSEVVFTHGKSHHELADFLKERNVDAVICGGVGQGMLDALHQYGISVFSGTEGDVDSAVHAFLAGQLGTPSLSANCSCHE